MFKLCSTTEIEEGQSKGFEVKDQKLFAVHKDGEFFVYRNVCPHLGVNLEWMPDQFLDSEGVLIQCATHGALFQIQSGKCIAGPCNGASLSAIASEVQGQDLMITL